MDGGCRTEGLVRDGFPWACERAEEERNGLECRSYSISCFQVIAIMVPDR